MADVKSKRELVIEGIKEGGATVESLIEKADCKYASLMSIFSTLRLMGMCPVKDALDEETGKLTYRFVTAEEWAAIKAEKAEKAASRRTIVRDPLERLAIANKAVARTEKAKDAALDRANKNDAEIFELRAQKAVIEFKIALHNLAEAQIAAQEVANEGSDEGPDEEIDE